jgi:hypothetical protein
VRGQAGDDYVYTGDYVEFHDDASFDGGTGYDGINVDGAAFPGGLKVRHFELIV